MLFSCYFSSITIIFVFLRMFLVFLFNLTKQILTRKMIGIEENKTNFLENLHHQITQKYPRFYKNIPDYHQKLDSMNFNLNLKDSIYKIRKKFELAQIRKNYASVVDEFEDILKKK